MPHHSSDAHDRLPPGQHLAAPGKWPIVGESQPRDRSSPWTLEVTGLVQSPRCWTLASLRNLPVVERSVDIHCVTRWSKLGVVFRGVRLADVLAHSVPLATARFVYFRAWSERGHGTSLPLDACLSLDVLLAWDANGQPLSREHGGPLRTIAPGKYFYKSVKWLSGIELLEEDRLGYWEGTAGYHNGADPWLEQRYMAPTLNKREAERLLAQRHFEQRDLRSLDAARRDLRGLDATNALLRDADFRGADLREARFDGANLSNAHFEHANLQWASFRGADLEGANFEGSDLRGADLRGASLFGATFVTGTRYEAGARMDAATRLTRAAWEQLAPPQRDFLVRTRAAIE